MVRCARPSCGKMFEKITEFRATRKYCSRACKHAEISRRWSQKNRKENPKPHKKPLLLICQNPPCQNEFQSFRSDAKYCCEKCRLSIWKTANKERLKEQRLARYERTKEQLHRNSKKWKTNNPMIVLAQAHERRARRIGAEEVRFNPEMIWDRDRGICQICGILCTKKQGRAHRPTDGNMDHITPLGPGPHSPDNCRLLCAACNLKKISKDKQILREWRSMKGAA